MRISDWSSDVCSSDLAISGASCTIRPPRPIAIEQQQGDADHNGAVGQVEGRPVPAGGVEIEKIVDRAMLPAVEDIAECAADDAAERHAGQPRVAAPPPTT